jgi:acyl carrier protein
MGLDAVELVMAIEEKFKIEVPDHAATHLVTVGHLRNYIIERLRARGESPVEAEVWVKLREIVVEQLGVGPEQVTPEASFVEDLGMD